MNNPYLGFISMTMALMAITASAQTQDSIHTHIDIQISGRPDTKKALLYESGADLRFKAIDVAKFVDGTCSFDYVSDYPREMQIIFDDEFLTGRFKIKSFYAEGDTVKAFFEGDNTGIDCIKSSGTIQTAKKQLSDYIDRESGGSLTELYRKMDEMESSGEMYIEEIRPIYLKMRNAKGSERDSLKTIAEQIAQKHDNNIKTEAYKKNYSKSLELLMKQDTIRWNYLIESSPSLLGLMEIRDQLRMESSFRNIDDAMERIETIFNANYGDFSYHPYYDDCKLRFATRLLRPGRKYDADYKIHAVDGSEATMSDLISGRPAIIDLWASWCGSCRRKSKALIPIYQKFAPFGLSYVAVAREFGDTKFMLNAIEKDGYPWQSYVDIDDIDGIWAKNGCPNSGGRIFLIASDGKIAAVDPEIEFIEHYLAKHFYSAAKK